MPRQAANRFQNRPGDDPLLLENIENCPDRFTRLNRSTRGAAWTRTPLGEDEQALEWSECMVLGESYVVRPYAPEAKSDLEMVHGDLIFLRNSFPDRDMILDLVRFEQVPVAMVGWMFAIGEELAERECQLVLMGLTPAMMPPVLMNRVLSEFEVI
ncbi:MAG: hypothetical protein ACLFOY_18685 [Desulfatibacillaceae bacterium]